MKQIILVLTGLIMSAGCREENSKKTETTSTVFIDRVVNTVPAKEAQDINESPLFSLQWKSCQGHSIIPSDFSWAGVLSRIPSRNLFVTLGSKSKNTLKILNPETGKEIAEATIPESILQNHRTLFDTPELAENLNYLTCRDQGNLHLIVKASQMKHSVTGRDRHGSGIGSALYCCSMNGNILWTFLGETFHSCCVLPVGNETDVIVIAQGHSNQIVLLSVEGKEIGRINTPTFNAIEIREENGVIKFFFLSDNIYCYAFNGQFIDPIKRAQQSARGDGIPPPQP